MAVSILTPRCSRRALPAVLALLVVAPPLCRAQAAMPAVAVHGAVPVCRQPHYIKPSDLAGIPGLYDLSNGDFLDVSRESRRFYAEMGRVGRMEIIPLNENEFVEKGGTLRFRFERDLPWSNVTIAGLDTPRSGKPACPP